jgi:outer membrane protein with beta-barrel domain
MRALSFVRPSLAAGLLALTLPAAAHAQRSRAATPAPAPTSGLAFEATPYVGYMVFGNYLSGPLGSSVSNAPAPLIGAELGMKITPNLAIVGNLATTSSDIRAGIPLLGGISVAHSRLVMYDAGLQLALPLTTAMGTQMTPFLQAGAGAMRYDITQSVVNTTATNFAANVGAGVDFAVGRGVGVRVVAKDYIGKFDAQQATYLDIGTNTTNNFAFNAGVRFSF